MVGVGTVLGRCWYGDGISYQAVASEGKIDVCRMVKKVYFCTQIEHCAVRELEEETGLYVSEQDIRLIGVYSTPGRDPRGRTVTAAYRVASGKWKEESARAGDDAAEIRWWPLNALPPLAFDHAEIVSDGQRL